MKGQASSVLTDPYDSTVNITGSKFKSKATPTAGVDIYKVMGEKPMSESEGLLKAAVNVLKRPADISLIPSVHGTDLMLALRPLMCL